jgi:hypothetical protein
MKRHAYMNKNELEYYNIVRSNAMRARMCVKRETYDCEGTKNVFATSKARITSVFERRSFYRGAWVQRSVTKGIKLIENVMKGGRKNDHVCTLGI